MRVNRSMNGAPLVAAATAIALTILVRAERALGPGNPVFALLVVWIPMTWLGTVSRVVQPRLPSAYHELRAFEIDGRIYERLGVRVAKRFLRRGPFALFNPGLHLPAERSPERLAHLDRRMRDAEASHFLLFVGTSGLAAQTAARRRWTAAAVTMLCNVAMNGYPVMLQRYNRALLHQRFPELDRRGT